MKASAQQKRVSVQGTEWPEGGQALADGFYPLLNRVQCLRQAFDLIGPRPGIELAIAHGVERQVAVRAPLPQKAALQELKRRTRPNPRRRASPLELLPQRGDYSVHPLFPVIDLAQLDPALGVGVTRADAQQRPEVADDEDDDDEPEDRSARALVPGVADEFNCTLGTAHADLPTRRRRCHMPIGGCVRYARARAVSIVHR